MFQINKKELIKLIKPIIFYKFYSKVKSNPYNKLMLILVSQPEVFKLSFIDLPAYN